MSDVLKLAKEAIAAEKATWTGDYQRSAYCALDHFLTRFSALLSQAQEAPSETVAFVEPSWKDEPPDWCDPKEEEIWQMGYDCAMSSCRSANKGPKHSAQAAPTPEAST